MKKRKISIQLENGKIINRKPIFHSFGNFIMITVRYNKNEYMLKEWDGDEYLRGETEKIYTLGKMVKNNGC